MIEIAFSSSFKRAFKKIELFKSNPFDAKLKTHRLSGKLKDLWSFSIEYDLRAVFYFAGDQRAVFVDIGSHKEVY